MSRDLNWGVPVPVEGAEGKVLYVWFDAPIGYISNTKEILPDSWETYRKDPSTRVINFIGKDNIVFHCIVFPAMLMAYGDGFQLPDNVPANEFLNLEGDKISTSRNRAVWLHEYLKDFPGKQDTLRYVLTANAPKPKTTTLPGPTSRARNNNELVAILGNFINRAVVLTHKYCGGCVPTPASSPTSTVSSLPTPAPPARPSPRRSKTSTSAKLSKTPWSWRASATAICRRLSPGRWPRPTLRVSTPYFGQPSSSAPR